MIGRAGLGNGQDYGRPVQTEGNLSGGAGSPIIAVSPRQESLGCQRLLLILNGLLKSVAPAASAKKTSSAWPRLLPMPLGFATTRSAYFGSKGRGWCFYIRSSSVMWLRSR